MAAMDPVKNATHKAAIAERQERLKRQDRAQAVRSVARGRRGI